MAWWNTFYNTGGGGGVTIVNLLKETEMEVAAKQHEVNSEASPDQIGVEFETDISKREVKIDAVWQKS